MRKRKIDQPELVTMGFLIPKEIRRDFKVKCAQLGKPQRLIIINLIWNWIKENN